MSARIPELSLAAYARGEAAARRAFSAHFMEALQRFGFVVVKDHEIAPDVVSEAYAAAEAVFALDDPVKRRYAGGLRGYTPFGVEHAKDSARPDLKEFWQIGHEGDSFEPNVWPAEVPEFRPVFQTLFTALNTVGVTLLQALAPELGLPERHFDPMVRRGTSLLRVLHYPPLQAGTDPACVRSAPHEDINFLTLMLAAKGPGLELQDRDGRWLPVEAPAGDLIVDSGDMLARMTRRLIPATTHRVVNPTGPNVSRYSMPFFMQPTRETVLKAPPTCAGRAASLPEITAGEFLDERLRAIGLAG